MKTAFAFFLFSAACFSTASAEEPALTFLSAIPLQDVAGRIDHMTADPEGGRLFVAALGNNSVEVVDLKAGKLLRSLPGFAEPQGLAYVPKLDRFFIANGGDGTCRILDGHSFESIASVKLGDDADNVRYDAKTGRIYVGYGSGALAVLDAKTGSRIEDIKLDGHPESFRLETTGPRIFVNVPQANHIAVVDREKAQVIGTWPLKEAKSNFPLFLDEANHRLFTGCRNPGRLLIYDYAAGRLVTSLPISGDTDDLFFDASKKTVYVSCGQGSIDVIQQTDADHYTASKAIATAPGARTSLFVPELKILCLAVPNRGNQLAEIRVFKTE